jgi:HEAT repeat protein
MSNQHLIRKLESSDVEVRREAARTLAQYPAMQAYMERDERDISDAIGPLAVALFDEDAEVRKHAARALRAAQSDMQDISAAIPTLVRCLSDERVDLCQAAVLILRDAVVKGWDATPYESQLGALLTDPIDEVKWGAADALAYHFAARKRWDQVAGLLNHADPQVAQETAGTLAEFSFRFEYEPVVAELVALLTAESLELRLVAAKAVAHRPRDAADLAAAIPVLLACLSNKEARIRLAAMRALDRAIAGFFRKQPRMLEGDRDAPAKGDIPAPVSAALPSVERALSDGADAVQAAAIETLATFLAAQPVSELDRYERLVQLVKERLQSGHDGVRKRAAEALTVQWLRAGRWEDVLALLVGQHKIVKRQVLNTLSRNETIRALGFTPLVPAILEMLSDPDGDLRYAAQTALERVDANILLEPLESALMDTPARRELLKEVRGTVHRTSIKALERELKGKSAGSKIAILTAHLDHKKATVRAWSAESLWWIGQGEDISAAIPQLIQLLDDPDPSARCAAAQALGDAARYGSIGEAHQRLTELTGDASAEVRKVAFRALSMSADSGGDLCAVLPSLCDTLRADPDPENRGEAAVVISTASRSCDLGAMVPDLIAALEDDFQRVRFYMARALHYTAKRGIDIQQAIPLLTRCLEDEQTVASWAVEALIVYATDATRAAKVLKAVRALGSQGGEAVRVIDACEVRLKGE